MAETSRRPEPGDPAFWSWLGFWAQFVVLGLCVVIGAFAASQAASPGDYGSGIVLILGALALAFLAAEAAVRRRRPRAGAIFCWSTT